MIRLILGIALSGVFMGTGMGLWLYWYGYISTLSIDSIIMFYQSYKYGLSTGYSLPIAVIDAQKYILAGGIFILFVCMILPWGGRLKGVYGTAKWATTKDIRKMNLFAKRGIILAMWGNRFIRTNQPLSVLVLAPPGTGKTVGVAIPNLLSCNNSMIINDVKNELWELTSGYRAKYQKVLRFAPGDKDGKTCQWNPLAKANLPENWNQKIVLIDRLANILYPVENPKDAHWSKNAQDVFKLFTMYEIYNNGETSFGKIRSLVLRSADLQSLASDISRMDGLPKQIVESCNAFLQKQDAELASIVSTFFTGLNVFADPMVDLATRGNDFTAQSLRNEKTSVYLCTKVEDMERLAPVMRMILECTMNDLLSQSSPPADKQITFLIDEFARMGKMDAVLKSPELSRGQKVNTIFIAQDYGQIEEKYSKNGVSQLETTTAFKIVFTQNNKDTAKAISDMIGKTTKKRKSINKDKTGKPSGESISLEGVPLISAEEIGSINSNTAIVIAQGYSNRPIKAKICKWFKNKDMQKAVKSGQAEVTPLQISETQIVSAPLSQPQVQSPTDSTTYDENAEYDEFQSMTSVAGMDVDTVNLETDDDTQYDDGEFD